MLSHWCPRLHPRRLETMPKKKEKSKSKGGTRGERKKSAQDAHAARSAGGASSGTPQTVKRGVRERVQDAAVGLKKTGDGKGKTAKLEESKPSGKAAERRAGGRSSETGAKKSGKTGTKGEEKKKVPREKEICIICQEVGSCENAQSRRCRPRVHPLRADAGSCLPRTDDL